MYTLRISITKGEGSLELQENAQAVSRQVFLVDRFIGRRLLEAFEELLKTAKIDVREVKNIDCGISEEVGASTERAVRVTTEVFKIVLFGKLRAQFD